jgi:pimeloyl-ACP methyl ester carboxylesterase
VTRDYRAVSFRSADGLKLFARDYPSASSATPLLCLPGLTRNSRDFEPAIPQLTAHGRVIVLDFRGRGRSEHADDPLTYRVDVELTDAVTLLDTLGIDRVAVIGTSRGGLVGTLMANRLRPRIAGLFLNDIGAHLEKTGLLRIRSYLGVEVNFSSFTEAAQGLKAADPGFTGMNESEWLAFARRIFRDQGGVPRLDYDPNLALTFPTREQIEGGLVPDAWPLFQNLIGFPVALLRGANSDLLSRRTVNAMRKLSPTLQVTSVPKRGHAPFLDEPRSRDALARWLAEIDRV